MASFKDRFKELRKENSYTLKEIGEKLGYSEANMSLYESGKREPKTAADYVKIADFFNVSLDYLLGRSTNKHGVIVETKIDGHDMKYEYDKSKKPEGLNEQEQKRVAALAKELYELMQKEEKSE